MKKLYNSLFFILIILSQAFFVSCSDDADELKARYGTYTLNLEVQGNIEKFQVNTSSSTNGILQPNKGNVSFSAEHASRFAFSYSALLITEDTNKDSVRVNMKGYFNDRLLVEKVYTLYSVPGSDYDETKNSFSINLENYR